MPRAFPIAVLAAALLWARPLPAHDGGGALPSAPALAAVRSHGRIAVDGRLDEAAWADALPAGGFRQRDPHEGLPASEATEVRVAYDDDALYVGLRLHDREPARIVRRLARRDGGGDADQAHGVPGSPPRPPQRRRVPGQRRRRAGRCGAVRRHRRRRSRGTPSGSRRWRWTAGAGAWRCGSLLAAPLRRGAQPDLGHHVSRYIQRANETDSRSTTPTSTSSRSRSTPCTAGSGGRARRSTSSGPSSARGVSRDGRLRLGESAGELLRTPADDVLMVKASYRIGR